MLAVSRAQKNPELLHRVTLILPMTEIVFKNVGVLYLLVKIHKTLKVRDKEVKNKYYRSCQINLLLLDSQIKAPPSRSTLGIPGIVDIGAKPKKAWFDFWLTLL
jgi:hypothetical protein